ncbi:hypothetical protein F4553_007000 [Allocatelliglobosispora scoriae]|uniref:Carrier domain-containing protein n=1 Tax=Allocatelliglobosispora scoriae TaxID=643052 RepID=A0A841C126_9ACTN|nr:acyl carrier protein [Allocatelliglobosispora scoriae]MBB5873566.1 hypothetical protein [Allocatelliglobosispora scoriae]
MSTDLRQRLAELVNGATTGTIGVGDALGGGSLRAMGLDSLGALRLIDAIDLEYGVEIDLGTEPGLDTLDAIARMVAARR